MSVISQRRHARQPELIHRPPDCAVDPTNDRDRFRSADWLACLLLALLQLLWAGYRLGVGNQSIQIPFLQHLIDPSLYPRDAMVRETLAQYPSFFFRALAWALPMSVIAPAYFALHLLTNFGVFAAMLWLGRAI